MENGLFKGLQSGMVSGGGPEPTPRPPTRPREAKPKKPVGLTKQISQKISLTSSKLTELKVICNKVNMAPLYLDENLFIEALIFENLIAIECLNNFAARSNYVL